MVTRKFNLGQKRANSVAGTAHRSPDASLFIVLCFKLQMMDFQSKHFQAETYLVLQK